MSDNIHMNHPERLAPLDTPLMVMIDGELKQAVRTKLVGSGGVMEYRLDCGEIVNGKFFWRYV